MKKLLFAVFAVALVFASCSSNDDGASSKPIAKQVAGHIEKGPFVQGSEVTLTELNKDLSQTGKSFTTNTSSDLGSFDFGQTLELSSGLVELKTSGYFYNECTGALSSSQITLKAIADVNDSKTLNVNLLTHLEYARVKKLVKDGMAFSQAKEQAEKEILKTFAITDKISTPEKVSLTDNSKDAAILLAISSFMLYDKSEAEFSEFIAKFSNDLERDGTIDDSSIKEKIKAGQENCHPSAIKKRMEEFYEQKGSSITIGDFSAFVDFNGDGVIDDKDGETLDKVPDSIVTEDTLFATEDNVQAVISGMYVWLRDYVKGQNELDAIRLDNANVNTIHPGAALVCNTWGCGYRVNSMALIVAKGLTSKSFPYDPMPYLAEANVLRAFVMYNMAMQWGRIPIVEETGSDRVNSYVQSETNDVLNFCLALLDQSKLPSNDYDAGRLNGDAVKVLKAEIYLAMGDKSKAAKEVKSLPAEDIFFIYETTPDGKPTGKIGLYSSDYVKLIKEEANGVDNSSEWFARGHVYGTFAALRRLGAVQDKTGIDAHYNLLPIPSVELMVCPKFTQNPGY